MLARGDGIEVGDLVRTAVSLAEIPAGALAIVKETGRPFIAVELLNGRIGYYAPRQLELAVAGPPPVTQDADIGLANAFLPPGSHMCLLAGGDQEATGSLAAYAAAGLSSGDRVVVVVPEPWREGLCGTIADTGHDVGHAVSVGDLVLKDEWDYYYGPDFTADKQINRLGEWLAEMARDRDRPLRVCGHTGGVVEKADADEWWEYERRVTPLARAGQMLTLCSYSLSVGQESDSCPTLRQRAHATHTHLVARGHLTNGSQAGNA